MRCANRKYKVPKWVMGERVEIAWLNIFRVRALCLAIHGYEPEMKMWDVVMVRADGSECALHPSFTKSHLDYRDVRGPGGVLMRTGPPGSEGRPGQVRRARNF